MSAGAEKHMILKRVPGVAALALLLIAPWTLSEEPGTYVGSTKCAACHSAINKTWQETNHAKAIESLKKSKQENPKERTTTIGKAIRSGIVRRQSREEPGGQENDQGIRRGNMPTMPHQGAGSRIQL